MKFGSRQATLGVMATVVVCLLLACSVRAVGQAGQGDTPLLARDYFLNVPDMGDVPVDEFMETMGMFAAALNLNCADCHTFESSMSWPAYADETPIKQTTRRMIRMVNQINEQHFGGVRFVTCWTCHRGDLAPKVVPSFSVQYGVPVEDPNEVMFFDDPTAPSPDEVFDRYLEALGGEEALSNLNSFIARGSYSGFDTGFVEVPVEIYADGPTRRATIVHAAAGDSVRTYDGTEAWVAATDKAQPLMQYTGGNLEGAKIEALLAFPAELPDAFSIWRHSYAAIGDTEVQVLQGTNVGLPPVNFYFDESGLLVRVLRFVETPVGRVPTQIDFSDYREVEGVQMPFQWTSTWTNGRATFQLTEIEVNVEVDPERFETPDPSPPAPDAPRGI